MNTTPWQKGFAAGRLGKPLDTCPYFDCAVWEWICGYLDGQAKRLRLVNDHPVNRESS
ncbi:hypothetical protein [Paraburkholderia sp. BL10I2N1]|uniref:hypothetical protein n=1 Tax=Paraburkholderia sp. BL10I2N1 TaxID=1938796 RepID=UPI0010EEB1B2|nr:hypothetical protein [Paraburkholderia sp. BL10I2N1]TDN58865.1 hypothetical protein B0G77_8032 [Paraburkholderia sp. BL10I2N1]